MWLTKCNAYNPWGSFLDIVYNNYWKKIRIIKKSISKIDHINIYLVLRIFLSFGDDSTSSGYIIWEDWLAFCFALYKQAILTVAKNTTTKFSSNKISNKLITNMWKMHIKNATDDIIHMRKKWDLLLSRSLKT